MANVEDVTVVRIGQGRYVRDWPPAARSASDAARSASELSDELGRLAQSAVKMGMAASAGVNAALAILGDQERNIVDRVDEAREVLESARRKFVEVGCEKP